MATIFPVQSFSGGSVATIQGMLLTMSEYVTQNITSSTVDGQQAIFQAIQQTLLNALDIIDAYQIQTLMAQEFSLLSRISGSALGLSPSDQVLIADRLASFNVLINTIYPLAINLPFNVNNLTSGQAALQAYNLISYMVQFNAETPPVGLNLTNFQADSQAMATAWFNALAFLQGSTATQFQLTTYGSVDRMAYSSQNTTDLVNNITLAASLTNTTQAWNSLIALPSLLRVAALLYNDPSSQLSQTINVLKFAIFNLIYETNMVLAAFNAPIIVQQPVTAVLKMGETMMDFANRTLGDYTQWTAIATANDLVPPYIGTTPAVGIAVPGQKLFLPPFSINSPLGNYTDAYLGTDIDLGPLYSNYTQWTGDFTLIKGLDNYTAALSRRILTPIGTFVFHPSYGSALPARIGNITTASEAFLLSSFLKSSLLSDPRTKAVNQITAYPVKFGQIVMTALVTPYGSNTVVPFNLVLAPQELK